MCAPAGDHAGAELLNAEPSGAAEIFYGHDAVDGVGYHRSRAEPGIVLEACGNGHRSGIAAGGISRQSDFDMLDLADAAVANEFAGAIELLPRALLRADLQDLSGGCDAITHAAPFGDRQRRRLLQVAVFLCVKCVVGDI